jgi:hypothetical protein
MIEGFITEAFFIIDMNSFEGSPLVDETVRLERFPGKGGWTYARITPVSHDRKNHFGWKKVRGFIDDYEINGTHLMPMGKGQLFLPVKAEIRKKINKHEGDWIKVVLYTADPVPPVKDEDFRICLNDEPGASKNFYAFPETEQKKYEDWIAAARSEEQKIERMGKAITRILEGKYIWKEL